MKNGGVNTLLEKPDNYWVEIYGFNEFRTGQTEVILKNILNGKDSF